MDKPKDIELRSEKIKNIIGQIPPFLIRFGNGLLCTIFVLLILIAAYVPFPYKTDTDISFRMEEVGDTSSTVGIRIPCNMAGQILKAKEIYFTLAAYPNEIFLPVKIVSISNDKEIINQTLYQWFFLEVENPSFEGKEEIKHLTVPLDGSMILNFHPQTMFERFNSRSD